MEENKYLETIDEINHLDEITLETTVQLMGSEDYRLRFVAEWLQTKIRYNNLRIMLIKYEAGTLTFKPKCDYSVLNSQLTIMDTYLKQLEIRAEIEGIKLPRI